MQVCAVLLVVGIAMGAVCGEQMDQFDVHSQPDFHANVPVVNAEVPKRCCAPSQWQGTIGGVVGYKPHWYSGPHVIQEVLGFYYDAKNKRVAMNGTVYSKGKPSHFQVIELFNQKKMYVIDNKGKCKSQDLSAPFQAICIPANATYTGRYTLGLGNESVQADGWFMHAMGYQVTFSHTVKECIPLSEIAWGRGEGWHKMPVMSTLGYVNVEAGIKTPTVFTPPKDCPAGVSELGNGLMKFMHGKMMGL